MVSLPSPWTPTCVSTLGHLEVIGAQVKTTVFTKGLGRSRSSWRFPGLDPNSYRCKGLLYSRRVEIHRDCLSCTVPGLKLISTGIIDLLHDFEASLPDYHHALESCPFSSLPSSRQIQPLGACYTHRSESNLTFFPVDILFHVCPHAVM